MNVARARVSLVVALVAIVVMGYACLQAQTFVASSMWFPTLVSLIGIAAAAGIAVKDAATLVRSRRQTAVAVAEPERPAAEETHDDPADDAPVPGVGEQMSTVDRSSLGELAYWTAWMAAFVAAVVVAGGLLGAPIWVFCFLRFAARSSLRFSLIGAVATAAVLVVAVVALDFAMPEGFLPSLVG